VRLNQFLARAAGGSRREADGWIREGRVLVNGRPPTGLGCAVEPGADRVTLDGSTVRLPEHHRYLAYYKPRGLLVSRRSQGGRRTIFDALGAPARGLHAVGRLDLESEGLLLLTDDGDWSEALLHPRTAVLRRYRVWVTPVPDPASLRGLMAGGIVEGVRVAPARVVLEGVEKGRGVLLVDLIEGKKREVRVLAAGAGLEVGRLVRVRFGAVHLGTLRPGALRPLTGAEVAALRREIFRGRGGGARLR
jgi:23S rRNA pseudouridine2605 synthase